MSSPAARSFGYQPALDGLRAFAVGAVMLYHAGVEWLPGGFLGVDIFFVLSGYLITSLLWIELNERGSIQLLAFWGRRFRRLLPALLLLVAAVMGWVAIFSNPEHFTRLRADGLSALFYVSNWQFIINGQSYFDQFATPSPFLHTWSLAIEEQWYLLWPMLLLGLWRILAGARHRLFHFAWLAALASALWMAWLYDPAQDPSRVYYGTDTRAQNLLIGSALAFGLPSLLQREWAGRLLSACGALGMVTLAIMMLLADDRAGWLYRGGFMLCALASASVIAAAVQPDGLLRRLLSLPFLRFAGRISYGLYLWHWPLYLALNPDSVGLEGTALLVLRIGATLAISTLSFYAFERPIRRGALAGPPIRALAALGVAGTAGLVIGLTQASAIDAELDIASEPLEIALGEPLASDGERLQVLVLGDSVAFSLAHSFPTPLLGSSIRLINRAALGCGLGAGQLVYGGRVYEPYVACADWPRRWHEADEESLDLVIVLIGAWEVVDHRVAGKDYRVGSDDYARFIRNELESGLAPFLERGTPVVLLTTPCFKPHSRNLNPHVAQPWKERRDPKRVLWLNRVLEGVVESNSPGMALIDLHEHSCNRDGTPGSIDGIEFLYDGVHFSKRGGGRVWLWLAAQLGVSPGE
jgi:peptidoglycan/LPS O-acetylase OafA/YrhL